MTIETVFTRRAATFAAAQNRALLRHLIIDVAMHDGARQRRGERQYDAGELVCRSGGEAVFGERMGGVHIKKGVLF